MNLHHSYSILQAAKPRSATASAEGGRFLTSEMSSDSLRKEPLYESTSCRRLITDNFTKVLYRTNQSLHKFECKPIYSQ